VRIRADNLKDMPARPHAMNVRFSTTQSRVLNDLVEKLHITKADIIRLAVAKARRGRRHLPGVEHEPQKQSQADRAPRWLKQ
jgi:hypothetical protein